MKVGIIGPLCKDCNIIKGREFHKPGGVTYYTGQALSSLEANTIVFASYDNRESHWLDGFKFNLVPIPKNGTIQFTNQYLDGDMAPRVQFANIPDNMITAEDILPGQLSGLDYIIFGPLFHSNFSDTLMEELSKNQRLVLAAQGMMRYLDNENRIVWKNPQNVLRQLPFVEYVFLDDRELEFIAGSQHLSDGASYLQKKGVKNVIVTLERRGSRLFLGNKEYAIKAYPPKTLTDPTGAGDTYMAGFLKALELYDDPIKQGEFAAMTSTLCIENQGPFTGTLDEVLKRLEQSDYLLLNMSTSEDMSNHFTNVSDAYNIVRDTDSEVIDLIARTIMQVNSPISLDFAAGTGRYPISIARKYGYKFLCADKNPKMLEKIQEDFPEGDGLIQVIQTNSLEDIEKPNSGYHVITLMNALHHFDDIPFLVKSVCEIISDGGYFLIYTRLDDQNLRTIWGQHFPEFTTRENRYLGCSAFPQSQLEEEIIQGGMKVEKVVTFELRRSNTLPELLEKVKKRHYSTFCLYSPEELEEAEREFVNNIYQAFLGSRNDVKYRIEHISPMSMIFITKNVG